MAGKTPTLTIILSTVIPVVSLVAIIGTIYYCVRRRRAGLFNRGITPIADEEIDSWRLEKNDEKDSEAEPFRKALAHPPSHHHHNSSLSSGNKPSSVIIYQNVPPPNYQARISGEQSPRSVGRQRSMDLPQTPVLARAPNSRPGLTDETVQGDDAYLPQVKRQPSRLAKLQSSNGSMTRPQHQRHRSAHTSFGRDRWYGQQQGGSDVLLRTRQSADNIPRRPQLYSRDHERGHSANFHDHRMSLEETSMPLVGMSPRPLIHKSDIGRAIG